MISQLFFVDWSRVYAGLRMTGKSLGSSCTPIRAVETMIESSPLFFSSSSFLAMMAMKSEMHLGWILKIFPRRAKVFFLTGILLPLRSCLISVWMFSAMTGVQMVARQERTMETSCVEPDWSCWGG